MLSLNKCDDKYLKEKLTKQTLLEQTMSEKLKERQEQEKRLQKVAKTMNHMERAKREEAAPLIEAAFQQRLLEEKVLHEREQQEFYRHLKKRLAAVFEQQQAERICKEIEEQEFEEAQAFLQETEKHLKRGKRKPILDGLEVELSRQYHDGDLKEKNRLARMLENYSGLEAGKGYQEEENILCEV
ncbi:hypothetical protein GOBAR_AA14600 [Gossypium barbadense]|uniref:Uncharacterized protein n=1 Tax=Gossypium barbadense TaxID=3634 RepID=A0A2P5XRR8_GOSBA|nr:hypothetical protein GOBAR_AA14600 [Gossypium barbadense]